MCNTNVPSEWLTESSEDSSNFILYLLPIIIILISLLITLIFYWFISSHRSCKLKSYILQSFMSASRESNINTSKSKTLPTTSAAGKVKTTAATTTVTGSTIHHQTLLTSPSSPLFSSTYAYESALQVPLLMKQQVNVEENVKNKFNINDNHGRISTQETYYNNVTPYLRMVDLNNYTGNSSTSGFNSDRTCNSSIAHYDMINVGNTIKYPSCMKDTDENIINDDDDVDDDDVDNETGEQYSSSGFGPPLLIQRSIARQIVLKQIIGRGRFGEVWKGLWRGEHVAVKIFSSRDETCWQREVEIYQTCMLRHENILGYISADNKDNGTYIQLFLITEYYEKGSLYDYLNNKTLTIDEMVSMAHSIVSGLCHLHYEIDGLQGKPPIAHRDLKSKNILVKSNTSCVIADLGLAVRQLPYSRAIDLPSTRKVGTRRYLPPEVLLDQLNTSQFDFDAFRMGDIYSLGLVLWELMNRTTFTINCDGSINSTDGTTTTTIPANEYSLPYQNMVSRDPSIEEMKMIVAIQSQRPPCSSNWNKNEQMKKMKSIISECWTAIPTARLSTLRAKKNLAHLKELISKQNNAIQ